jgi:hypothetical protein
MRLGGVFIKTSKERSHLVNGIPMKGFDCTDAEGLREFCEKKGVWEGFGTQMSNTDKGGWWSEIAWASGIEA